MTYIDNWKAISSRIRGLVQAGQLHARFLAVRDSDSYGRGRYLLDHCRKALNSLEVFSSTFGGCVPVQVAAAIGEFLDRTKPFHKDATTIAGTRDTQQEFLGTLLVQLAAFDTEMSFLLSGR